MSGYLKTLSLKRKNLNISKKEKKNLNISKKEKS
jgi:hypothetical protein